MDFRVLDGLFVLTAAAGIAVVASTPYLEEPYPAVVVGAFAVGALTFAYLTARLKLKNLIKTIGSREEARETEETKFRQGIERNLAALEELTGELREDLTALRRQTTSDAEALRRGVNDVVNQANKQLEILKNAIGELKAEYNQNIAALTSQMATVTQAAREAEERLRAFAEDFNAFVADEQHFREVIQNRLADRVAYLEDFIREKRKSLQI